SGKTGLVHNIIRAATKVPWMVVVGIDAQPGAVEFGPWERAMVALARSVGAGEEIFAALMAEAERRGALMKERGWRNWQCSEAEPHIMTVIDEVQLITEDNRTKAEREGEPTRGDQLAELAGLIRKFGMSLVIATQYPTDKYVPFKVVNQVTYRIGLRTETDTADRVIFGEDAKEVGWRACKLPADQPGYFYIKGAGFDSPVICLTDDLPDSVLERVQKEAAEVTVEVLRAGVPAGSGGELVPVGVSPATAGMRHDPEEDVVEAVLVEPTTRRDKVLWSVQNASGVVHRGDIQQHWGMDQKTADKYLKVLEEDGLVVKVGPARYVKA
ncbi:MAG TPA: hypothetical protein VFU47_07465, partial [Armatimonadota bacterium]|nr:hypothetical protein [Armatimonadota bacterium]